MLITQKTNGAVNLAYSRKRTTPGQLKAVNPGNIPRWAFGSLALFFANLLQPEWLAPSNGEGVLFVNGNVQSPAPTDADADRLPSRLDRHGEPERPAPIGS